MGAIAVHLARAGPPDPSVVRRMLEAAPHRGERRTVEVLDRAAAAVCNEDDWITATMARRDGQLALFCGALDNDEELRADLRRTEVREPRRGSPAHMLLAAWRAWGEAAVGRFRGSFAAVVTDGREVRCFRDAFGTSPLFHHDGAEGLFLATEVKQVLAGAPIPREPDLDHLHGVLFGGLDRSTAYRGVERIPKQVVAATDAEPGFELRRYWNPADHVETRPLDLREAVEGTVEALRRAVRRALTGRDAILLSGGLDSPALAAFASPDDGFEGRVDALTAVYPDHPTADEREWTGKVADHLGLPLYTFRAEAASLDDVDRWVEVLDGPVDVVSIPESAEAYRHARELGARTVLNGEIAEMLFESRVFLLDHLVSHGRLRPAVRVIDDMRAAGWSWGEILRRIARALSPGWLLEVYRRLGHGADGESPAWVDPAPRTRADGEPPFWKAGPRTRWVRAQTAPFRGPGIGFEADEICAAVCGVESRRPFTDVDLWEFVLGLPAEVKFSGRRAKPLLRRAMRGHLPDEVIDRRDKTYFDEFHLATADYPTLRRLLVDPDHRMEGIDYGLLADRLRAEDLGVYELQWARNVARVHAFLGLW